MEKAATTGRLVQLKFKRNREARAEALASIRERPQGNWQVRVGGRMRGRTVIAPSRAAAERIANDYYNDAIATALGIGLR